MLKVFRALLKSKKAKAKPDKQTKPLTVKDALKPQTVHDALPPSQENQSAESQSKADRKTDSVEYQPAANVEQKEEGKINLSSIILSAIISALLGKLFDTMWTAIMEFFFQ